MVNRRETPAAVILGGDGSRICWVSTLEPQAKQASERPTLGLDNHGHPAVPAGVRQATVRVGTKKLTISTRSGSALSKTSRSLASSGSLPP